ncbi:MAG TPA: hypothetical protein VHA75_14185, partial [Rugosimonospora sp.]|nr:hypothetical protein [Rugosimonospora sp.]
EALTLIAEHDPGVPPAAYPLHRAQRSLARAYGFPGWTRLVRHCELVRQHSRTPDTVGEQADPAAEFLRLACLTYGADSPERRERAVRILAAHPEIRHDLHVAAARADVTELGRVLAGGAGADTEGGPFGWTPLLYLAYARHDPEVTRKSTVDTARLLLAHGADPNAGFLWHGLPTPFTVLTGVFGEGEAGPAGQPVHPHALALAEVLLDAGADPNDGQALYNRMFSADDSHLELLLRYGLGRGDGGPWHRRLGPALDPPAQQVRDLLWWAVTHGQAGRVRLLAGTGVDLTTPNPDGTTLATAAALYGYPEIEAVLRAHGVPPPRLDPPDALVAAIFAGGPTAGFPDTVRDAARRRRPGLAVFAAGQQRAEVVRRLIAAGWDPNVRGRGDAPVEQPWETALHQAAGHGDSALVADLLAAGADPRALDQRFQATPRGWAEHFGHAGTAALL